MEFDVSKLPRRDILCVDMKAFFASVECIKRNLDPLTTFLVVIGKKDRLGSVVLASSPAVKKEFGIKTGNRLYEIPNDSRIILAEPSMKLYLHVNRIIQDIFRRYVSNDDLHIYSIDESFLDVTASRKLFGDKFTIAKQIRQDIERELRLCATIGIGDNPLLAKLCLDNEAKKRPGGIAYWSYEDVPNTVWKIKTLTDMWGIGPRTARTLNRMGICTVSGLAKYDVKSLKRRLGVMGEQLYYHAWGVDFSRISDKVQPREKSYGKSQILLRDYKDAHEIETVICEMADDVAARLRKHKVVGEVVHLSVGFSKDEFGRGFSQQMKLETPTDLTSRITEVCLTIFRNRFNGHIVRSIGISVGKISSKTNMQLNLFSDTEKIQKEEALDATIDSIRNKFGKTAILKASSYANGGTALKRAGLVGGHQG
ncbi:DinB/UmuC family translesion DNA polymerase [Bacillus sp. JJ722]|uniref:Y-family DNA polymerase n=1 Tax=Bacillus sp. JJ722 TaxID=3122973 RepID=UPI003000DE5C